MESQQLETGKEWQPFELVSIGGGGGGQAATSDTLTIAAAQLKIVSSVCVAFQTIEIGRARIYAASTKGAITRRYSAPRG